MTCRTVMYLVLAISVATTALAAEIPAELQQAIRERDEAVEKKDVATWDRLTTPEFIAVRPDGRLMKKAERLAQLKAEKPEARPKPQQEQFIRYGDTVLRQLQQTNGTLWIDVWVKEGQVWRVASSQGTPSTPSSSILSQVDHLIYATPDLDMTVAEIERLLGVRAAPGASSRVEARGTH